MNPRSASILILTMFAWGCGAATAHKTTPLVTKPAVLQKHEVVLQINPKLVMGVSGSFRAKVTIDANIDNRVLVFRYDGPMYRASYVQLDEFNADQNTFDFLMNDVPSGDYVVQVTLFRMQKGELVPYTDSTEVTVCGPGMDSCGSKDAKF
jgi:hypothetical protein